MNLLIFLKLPLLGLKVVENHLYWKLLLEGTFFLEEPVSLRVARLSYSSLTCHGQINHDILEVKGVNLCITAYTVYHIAPSDWTELMDLEDTEWGEFSHLPNKQFRDFTEIRKEIDNRTAEIAGANKTQLFFFC
mgnify:CR=1 FL=1